MRTPGFIESRSFRFALVAFILAVICVGLPIIGLAALSPFPAVARAAGFFACCLLLLTCIFELRYRFSHFHVNREYLFATGLISIFVLGFLLGDALGLIQSDISIFELAARGLRFQD